ncbi:MAG: serine/threonine protein kinase [Coriobacteriia bacterium]|nr:serine/threonine protein kinase [Coriobacteriia bacterium]
MEQQLILDRYRPLGELGEGGFGSVALAWDTRIQRRVAIKRIPLPLDVAGNPDRHPPGLAEARTAAMLNHPSIVTVYDFATDANEAFIIMEHVDGAPLDTVLAELGGSLTLDETATIVESVGKALAFAHSNGVLHLDIKPANVLVTLDGRIKVADFGVSALSSAVGHKGGGGGTLGHMPLEQLDSEPVDETTDEWALAALVYECVCGTNPFDAATVAEAAARLERPIAPPSTFDRSVPSAVDLILLAALDVSPDERYPAIVDFTGALLPHLGDPAAGRESLAELVESLVTEAEPAEDEDADIAALGLWDRLRGRTGQLLLRAIAATESGWLAWAGLSAFPLENAPRAAAIALVALVAVLAPSLGAGVALLAFAAGLFARGLSLLGAAFVVVGAAWWWLSGRKSAGAAVLPAASPLLGIARIPLALPLLAGFALPPLSAAVTGLAGGLLGVLASAASGGGVAQAPYVGVGAKLLTDPAAASALGANVAAAFTSPATWIAIASWPLAALAMSLFARRSSRAAASIGAALGAGILVGGYGLARVAASAQHGAGLWLGDAFALSLAGSLILVYLVIALGAPVRGEQEYADLSAAEQDE